MIDKTAFIAGVQKKADDLFLTSSLRNQLLKFANIMTTDDSITSAMGNDPSFSGFLGHLASRGLPYAGAGAVGGSLLADHFMSGKDSKRKQMIGGAAGAAIGQGYGMYNDARGLAENELSLRKDNLIGQLLSEESTQKPTAEALKNTMNDSWSDVYLGGLNN